MLSQLVGRVGRANEHEIEIESKSMLMPWTTLNIEKGQSRPWVQAHKEEPFSVHVEENSGTDREIRL